MCWVLRWVSVRWGVEGDVCAGVLRGCVHWGC